MLEMSYGLGPEGGGVDYLAARYVGSAKVKAAQGDLSAAAERLDAGMKTAENLQLPRLAAAINNERIRLGVAPSVAARLRSVRFACYWQGFGRRAGPGMAACDPTACRHGCPAKAVGGAAR